MNEEIEALKKQKDLAYSERNKLVALLSKLFPASLERHPEEDKDWEDDWRWVVYIQLPTGQVSWHIHDSELPLFDHLPAHQGVKWDGHDNSLKWLRTSLVPAGSGHAGLSIALEGIAIDRLLGEVGYIPIFLSGAESALEEAANMAFAQELISKGRLNDIRSLLRKPLL